MKTQKNNGSALFSACCLVLSMLYRPVCGGVVALYIPRSKSKEMKHGKLCFCLENWGTTRQSTIAATQKSAVIVKCRKWPKRLFSHSTKASLQPNKKSWRRSFQVLLSYESGWRTSRCPGRPGRHACLPEIWSNGVNRHTDYTVYIGKRGRRPAMDVGKIKTGLSRLVSYLPFIPHMSVQVPGFH